MREWTGKIVLADAWALFVGNGGVTPVHEHLAYKIVIGLDGPAQVADSQGRVRSGRILPVPPGSLHQVLAPGARVGLYFADAGAFPNPPPLGLRDLRSLVSLCRRLEQGDPQAIDGMSRIFRSDGSCAVDQRVAAAVRRMSQPDEAALDRISSGLGLSHSRLSHLFTAAIGGAPVRYRRWRRLRLAAELLGRGERIVDAALGAGFSDAAHLTRTFVEMLGITPGLFQASEVIALPVSPDPP